MGTLTEYQRKRDFRKTGEPKAGRPRKNRGGKPAFVVQKHDASRLHYDFRLEMGGVLKSWAVPKGPSDDTSDKRLAVMVEDHPLDYGEFEGIVPEGEYGAGPVLLWDCGTWEPEGRDDPLEALEDGSLKFTLHGEKLSGSWALVKMKKAGENDWLLIKHKDRWAAKEGWTPLVQRKPKSVKSGRTIEELAGEQNHDDKRLTLEEVPQARTRNALPRDLSPSLATLVDDVPPGEDWLHEIKFDGYRILAEVDQGGKVRLVTRNGKDWTQRFGTVAKALQECAAPAVLDGEVVVLDDDGRSSFQALQRALKGKDRARLVYYVFDLPWCDGHDLRKAALSDRKKALEGFLARSYPNDELIRYSDHLAGNGRTFFEKACRNKLEGVISKKATSAYAGKRTRDWLKVKCTQRQEFVIGGFTEASGSRIGFGALLLGVFADDDTLRYAGRVGTGFDDDQLRDLRKRLGGLTRKATPFANPPEGAEARGVTWVRPELVAEVAFTEWTGDGRLRHPAFQGLREDKGPEAVQREQAETPDRANKKGKEDKDMTLHGITITHPDREVFPEADLTKGEVAQYYAEIAPRLLEHIADRPLSVVRCPQGRQKKCFYQKHRTSGMPAEIGTVKVREREGRDDYLTVNSPAGVVALVQFGVIEIHPWLSRNDKLDRPDQLVFDLDPADDVDWKEVLGAAHLMREVLHDLELESFPKTTGGKGIHVVVPLVRRAGFDEAKPAAKAIVKRVRERNPDKFLITASKEKRKGKIFLDYLRNGRGATAVAPYSVRARSGAPVAVPVGWDEVNSSLAPDRYTIRTLEMRLQALKHDPWDGFSSLRQSLTKGIRNALGV